MTVKYIVREAGVSKEDIKLISFSAQMHSLVAMDAQNKRLTENITWADNRASRYADLMKMTTTDSIFIIELVHRYIQCHHYQKYFG